MTVKKMIRMLTGMYHSMLLSYSINPFIFPFSFCMFFEPSPTLMDRIKDCWFGVLFHVTRTFSFEEVESVYRGEEGPASDEIRTMLNIALKVGES